MLTKINEESLSWVCCPSCGSKTRVKLLPDTELKNFPLFCPKCKKTVVVNIKNLKMELIGAALGRI